MPTERTDLSPYVVHLTRDYNGSQAEDNLRSILTSSCIEARNPYGIAVAHLRLKRCTDAPFIENQKVACFSETPLRNLNGLIDPGIWRRYHFRPYGVAFSRERMLEYGATPIWYVNQYRGNGFRWLVHDLNALIDEAALENETPAPEKWAASPIARLTPFMEAMGEWGYGMARKAKDFAFEREWRYQGNFAFHPFYVQAIIVPPGKAESFRESLRGATIFSYVAEGRCELLELAEPEAQD